MTTAAIRNPRPVPGSIEDAGRWSKTLEALTPIFLPTGPSDPGALGPPVTALVAMLNALDLATGHTALVIGDGTGTSHLVTAALCQVLGDQAVTLALEKPRAVLRAVAALQEAEFSPKVVAADGLLGWAPGGFYHRAVGLMAPWTVPDAWIGQTHPGGLIVTPLGVHAETVLRLRVTEDRTVASGRAVPLAPLLPGSFPQLLPADTLPALAPASDRLPHASDGTPVDAKALSALVRADPVFLRFLHLALPDLDRSIVHNADGAEEAQVWIDRRATPSWARLRRDAGFSGAGPRDLVSALLSAAEWWTRAGMPRPDRWGLTVHRSTASGTPGSAVWIDNPTGARLDLPLV